MAENEGRQPRKGSMLGKAPWVRPKRNVIRLPKTATRRAATRTARTEAPSPTERTEAPSPVPSSSHQPRDPDHEELLMSDTESRRDAEYCRVRYPDADDYDLFDDEDHSQSSQSSQSQSSFGVPITPTPARKLDTEGSFLRGSAKNVPRPVRRRSKRFRYGELPCLEFGVYLDGLRLGMRELSCPVSVTALRRNPTPHQRPYVEKQGKEVEEACFLLQRLEFGHTPKRQFWLTLGDTDEEGEAKFEERKKARARWTVHVRDALQRALNDIRTYVLDANGRLVPAPKVKIIPIGSQPSTSQRTPDGDDEEDDDTAWRKD